MTPTSTAAAGPRAAPTLASARSGRRGGGLLRSRRAGRPIAGEARSVRDFLAVVGTSGCGKSSLVHAGLIPALRDRALGLGRGAVGRRHDAARRPAAPAARRGPDRRRRRSARPGQTWTTPPPAPRGGMRRGPLGLAEALADAPPSGGRKLLLLVDQFEELFRFRREGEGQRDEADAFVALLLATAAQRGPARLHRPDHAVGLSRRLQLFDGLPEALNDSQFLTPRLTRDQRQQAIEGAGPGLRRPGRAGAGQPHAQRHGRGPGPAPPDAARPDAALEGRRPRTRRGRSC